MGGTRLIPMDGYGLKVMSIGFLIEEETPMIWRGPMVMSALTQMLREVEWGELDVMVVDMPPGTGDAQLTMAQQVPLRGAVIVSTPQDLALIDARRGIAMFRRVNVPVLGIVENMSYFLCPQCGTRSDIFGHGGARHEAERLGVPFLGEVPLHMEIRERSDAGLPVVATVPDGLHARDLSRHRGAGARPDRGRAGPGGAEDRHRGVDVRGTAGVVARSCFAQNLQNWAERGASPRVARTHGARLALCNPHVGQPMRPMAGNAQGRNAHETSSIPQGGERSASPRPRSRSPPSRSPTRPSNGG